MRKKSLTKEQREIQIMNVFQQRIQDNNKSTASLAEIARGIGISPSSHLRKILEHMVDDDILTAHELKRSGRWLGRGYRLKRGTYSRPAGRNVVINFTLKGIHYKQELVL